MSKVGVEIFIKPGWKNFLVMALIWLLGLSLYISTASFKNPVLEIYQFYLKYSWPNFLIAYIIVVWLVPVFLHSKRYVLFAFVNLLVLACYILVRYLNNTAVVADYYTIGRGGKWEALNWLEIIRSEMYTGLTFMFIGYTYRFIFDWGIIERRRQKLEKEKLVSDLALLRYQVNPHFLFNAINNIYYLSIIKSDKTPDSLLKLSELLRYVLYEKEDWVPLEREVEHLERMIDFQRFRFPDNVISFTIDKKNNGQQVIPPLLLTTFTENAFKHGAPGTAKNPLVICLQTDENMLRYRVLNALKPELSKDSSSGIGLENLKRRLQLLYPGKYKLNIVQNEKKYLAHLELNLKP